MNFRFYTIYFALLSLTETAVAANNAAWNCEQGANGEWSCLNQGPAAAPQPAAPQTSVPAAATPASAKAVDTAPSTPPPKAEVQTVTTAQPKPEAPAQPVANNVAPPSAPVAAEEQKKLHVRMTENQKPVFEKVPARRPETNTSAPQQASGWTCKSGEEKSNWNCNLAGPDPKGEAQVVAETQPTSVFLTPTYNHQQERTFQTLRDEFPQDPWQNCASWSKKKRKPKQNSSSQQQRDGATTDVDADFSEIFDGEVMSFAGNVDLRRADQHLMADKASYDTVADTMDAQGNVLYSEGSLAMASDTASLSLNKDEARMRRTQFIAAEAPLRGTAETVYRDSKTLSRYHEATFTSCPPGNQDWIAHADRIKINRESGIGSAKNAWLEFKGVPVMYTPYISFPVDSRRTSGFLAPTWGSTQRNGFDVAAPFYWNIAPNFDDTITPRYMANRGGMLRNKFRYMTDSSQGTLGTEIMPYDQLENKSRYSVSFKDKTTYTPHLSSIINANKVSDQEYLNDLNNALGFQRNRFLPSTAYVNYGRPDVSFSTGVQSYQSIDKTLRGPDMPYDILPRVNFNLGHDFQDSPISLSMINQFTSFSHDAIDNNGDSAKVNGKRFVTTPSISLPLENSAGFFTPRITGHYTQYQLSDQTQNEINNGLPDSISRMLPIFSVDSGLQFEKDLNLGGSAYTHTLEPRAFYLYIPRKDQSDIPLFDTAAYDTNFYSLFRENHFSGYDRIQDANQITLAGTSRLIDSSTGLEPLKVSLGQIIYFQDRTVDLDYNQPAASQFPTQTSSTSNFIGEVGGQLNRYLSYSTGLQWSPSQNDLTRGQAVLKYRNQPDQIFDVGYRYRRNDPTSQSTLSQSAISQSDISFRWPLFANWYGLGRWQYSFDFNKTTESFIGFEKENCCWRLRVIGRRYINGANSASYLSPDAKPENAFFVQLELKGLTNFGDDVDKFLKKTLNGYRPDDDYDD